MAAPSSRTRASICSAVSIVTTRSVMLTYFYLALPRQNALSAPFLHKEKRSPAADGSVLGRGSGYPLIRPASLVARCWGCSPCPTEHRPIGGGLLHRGSGERCQWPESNWTAELARF